MNWENNKKTSSSSLFPECYNSKHTNLSLQSYLRPLLLFQELSNDICNATRAMSPNRPDPTCPLPSVSIINEKERCNCASITARIESDIVITGWKNNAVVSVALTIDGKQPLGSVKRWLTKDMKHVKYLFLSLYRIIIGK